MSRRARAAKGRASDRLRRRRTFSRRRRRSRKGRPRRSSPRSDRRFVRAQRRRILRHVFRGHGLAVQSLLQFAERTHLALAYHQQLAVEREAVACDDAQVFDEVGERARDLFAGARVEPQHRSGVGRARLRPGDRMPSHFHSAEYSRGSKDGRLFSSNAWASITGRNGAGLVETGCSARPSTHANSSR